MKYSESSFKCPPRKHDKENGLDPKQHFWAWESDLSNFCKCGVYIRILCACKCRNTHYKVEKVSKRHIRTGLINQAQYENSQRTLNKSFNRRGLLTLTYEQQYMHGETL